VGLLVYVLAIQIQESIFSGLEFIVGMMLVFLGITTVLDKRHIFKFKHKHPHQHSDGTIHFHEHDHSDTHHRHNHTSYMIGLVHGLAGSGSLVVLTATTLSNPEMILGFILVFGLGSIIGMVMMSGLIGLPFTVVFKTKTIHKIFRYAAGAFSCVLGINIMYGIGILGNLFDIF
jgi:ABC-type nickel/cobalt efflux system permease component RcnA